LKYFYWFRHCRLSLEGVIMQQTVLITGGARGIGYGIAEMFAKAGYRLAICATSPVSKYRVKLSELEAMGAGKVLYCQCDIADASSRQTMLKKIATELGTINILINNAGVAPNVRADLLEADEVSYERVMGINLRGPHFLTQQVAKMMIAQRQHDAIFKAAIIFVGSISATVASVNRGEYCLSKSGIAMAVKLWAVRLSEFDIPVYELRPGIIQTDMTSGVKEKYDQMLKSGLCLQQRWGKTEDVGRAALMLARGDLPYSTGQVINIDGGMLVDRL
jgi:NAD(P)-dependent dehydrogenase (short-subunit alcohol dehydrogenase family)